MKPVNQSLRNVLRLPKLKAKTGLSRSSVYAKLDSNSKYFDKDFPKQIRLGANSVGWVESDVDAWLDARIEKSREMAPGVSEASK